MSSKLTLGFLTAGRSEDEMDPIFSVIVGRKLSWAEIRTSFYFFFLILQQRNLMTTFPIIPFNPDMQDVRWRHRRLVT